MASLPPWLGATIGTRVKLAHSGFHQESLSPPHWLTQVRFFPLFSPFPQLTDSGPWKHFRAPGKTIFAIRSKDSYKSSQAFFSEVGFLHTKVRCCLERMVAVLTWWRYPYLHLHPKQARAVLEYTLRIGKFSWFAWNTALLQRPAILDRANQVADVLSKETPDGNKKTWPENDVLIF